MRLDRTGGLQAGSCRHRGNNHVGVAHRVSRRFGEPHADRFAGRLQPRAVGHGEQDVPSGDALYAGLAQARGNRLAGLAEANEGYARCVAAGHGHAFPEAGASGVPCVWNDSMVCNPQAWPFLRSASVQVIGFQSGARISLAPALATSTRLPPGS